MATFKHYEVGWTSTYGQYIPPDFNPEILRKHQVSRKRNSDGFTVRNMLPFTIICTKCGKHMARGTKFNMRGERMQHSEYLGQHNIIFTFHCSGCSGKCQFRTDYEHSTYETVTGCILNNEPFKRVADEEKKTAEELEEEDAMKRLERLTKQLKNSSAMQEQVDDLIRLNRRKGITNTDTLRQVLKQKRNRLADDDLLTDMGAVFRAKRLKLEAERAKENQGYFKGMFGISQSNSFVKSLKDEEKAFLVAKPCKKRTGKKKKKKKKKKLIVEITL